MPTTGMSLIVDVNNIRKEPNRKNGVWLLDCISSEAMVYEVRYPSVGVLYAVLFIFS